MAALRNYRATFIRGKVTGWGSPCVDASPSTSYTIALYAWNEGNKACSGIVLDAQGFDSFLINITGEANGNSVNWNIIVAQADNDVDSQYAQIYSQGVGAYWGGFSLNQVISISKRYIKIYAQLSSSSGPRPAGYVNFVQTQEFKNVSATVKTPQKYPVYNATVNVADIVDGTILGSSTTGADGKSGLIRIDIIDHPNIKIWGEKTINKSLLNISAKDISVLKEINVDT